MSGQLCFSGQAQVAQKSWMIKNTCSIQWKISGKLCFSGQAHANCSKIQNVKSIFNRAKHFWATLFFRANASCSKILNDKKYSTTVKNSRATLFFRASASCSKILNKKKYMFSTVNSGPADFQGKHKVAQKSWMVKSIFNTAKNFRANSVFRASASC